MAVGVHGLYGQCVQSHVMAGGNHVSENVLIQFLCTMACTVLVLVKRHRIVTIGRVPVSDVYSQYIGWFHFQHCPIY